MALRPLICLFFRSRLRQVSLYVLSIYAGVNNWKAITLIQKIVNAINSILLHFAIFVFPGTNSILDFFSPFFIEKLMCYLICM